MFMIDDQKLLIYVLDKEWHDLLYMTSMIYVIYVSDMIPYLCATQIRNQLYIYILSKRTCQNDGVRRIIILSGFFFLGGLLFYKKKSDNHVRKICEGWGISREIFFLGQSKMRLGTPCIFGHSSAKYTI